MSVPQGLAMEDGVSIYELETPVFLRDGNRDYYLDDANAINAESKLNWVDAVAPAGALLDIGANFGHFASVATRTRQVTALEPSATAARWAQEHLAVPVQVGSVYDQRPDLDGAFSVVTMWDVIEHLPDPDAALNNVKRWLQPGGVLFMTTPDTGSLVARLLGRRWYHFDLMQHIALFNRNNLRMLLERHGFRVCATRSFGRIYSTVYVCERLGYFGRSSLFWRTVSSVARLASRALPARVAINVRDVMGIAAKVEP